MFTDHQIDLFAEALHITHEEGRIKLEWAFAVKVNADHAAAILDNQARLVSAVAKSEDVPAHVGDTARMMLDPFNSTAAVVGLDHDIALIDDRPCVKCGEIELHPNHRGARHMHRPDPDR